MDALAAADLRSLVGGLLAVAPVVVVVADADGRVTTCAGAGLARAGIDPERALGERVDAVLGAGVRPGERVPLTLGGLAWDCDQRALRDAAGGVTGLVCVAAPEERLDQSRRMEVVGELAGGLAHDFGNLVQTIRTGAETLIASRDRRSLPAELGTISDAAERAAELCTQLLVFARGAEVADELVDVGELVRELRPLMRMALNRGTSLRTNIGVALPPARIDGRRLERALLNLVVNARDALPQGGEVRVATDLVDVDQTQAAREPGVVPGTYVRLTVSDTGHGMSDTVRARAFEPFYTTKSRSEGTGLGLATVYGMIRQAGGSVVIESAPGKGTAVRLLLPAATARPATAPPRGRGERVLIVEDSDPLRRYAQRALSADGYAVTVASTAEAAELRLLDPAAAIDVLVTDVRLPGIDGLALAARARERHPSLAVLVVSGDPLDADLAAALDPPATFVLKPFRSHDLLGRVREALGGG